MLIVLYKKARKDKSTGIEKLTGKVRLLR